MPLEPAVAFLLGGVLSMILVGGWPPEIDSSFARFAFYVGGRSSRLLS
jgi:hypothetical protein